MRQSQNWQDLKRRFEEKLETDPVFKAGIEWHLQGLQRWKEDRAKTTLGGETRSRYKRVRERIKKTSYRLNLQKITNGEDEELDHLCRMFPDPCRKIVESGKHPAARLYYVPEEIKQIPYNNAKKEKKLLKKNLPMFSQYIEGILYAPDRLANPIAALGKVRDAWLDNAWRGMRLPKIIKKSLRRQGKRLPRKVIWERYRFEMSVAYNRIYLDRLLSLTLSSVQFIVEDYTAHIQGLFYRIKGEFKDTTAKAIYEVIADFLNQEEIPSKRKPSHTEITIRRAVKKLQAIKTTGEVPRPKLNDELEWELIKVE